LINEYEEIERLKPTKLGDRVRLLELASHDDEMVRLYSLRELSGRKSQEASEAILRLAKDKSSLVRMEVFESIERLKEKKLEFLAIDGLKDRNTLVRSRAVLALGRMESSRSLQKIRQLRKTATGQVALASEAALNNRVPSSTRISNVIRFLRASQYQLRCAAANCLVEMVSPIDEARVLSAFQRAYKLEKTVAVKSTIQRAIKKLGGRLPLDPE
jgi:HEAT repeat protein